MGDPLVPYRKTNIPCDLGKCLEALSFQRNLSSKRDPCNRRARPPATRGILYLGNKMASCDCLKVALCDWFAHKKRHCMHT